jgi:thioredoxin reductase
LASDKVRIRFEGKALECRPDTTVAVALWENGVRHLSHSPKYGRPRGVTCARGHCTACLMRVDSVPNVRTCELPVREGMEVARQDAGAFYAAPMQKVMEAGHAFFPVGFYYKWFTKPASLSRFFLDRIRPLTGIGRLPGPEHAFRPLPPASQTQVQEHGPAADLGRFDTIIVGAGPSGLEAAENAVGSVLVVDDHTETGGQRYGALRHLADQANSSVDHFPALKTHLERIENSRRHFAAQDNHVFLGGTRAIAGYQPDGILLRHHNHLQTVCFNSLVWAAGALDTLGLFPGNDTPGVLGPRALYRLLIRDGLDLKNRHVLVIGGGQDFWLSAALLDAGRARLSLVVTEDGAAAELPAAMDHNWQLNTGLRLQSISGRGGESLRAFFTPAGDDGNSAGSHLVMNADLVVICGRGKPSYDVPYQLGADLSLQPDLGGFNLRRSHESGPGGVICTLPGGSSLMATGEAAGFMPGQGAFPAGEVETP